MDQRYKIVLLGDAAVGMFWQFVSPCTYTYGTRHGNIMSMPPLALLHIGAAITPPTHIAFHGATMLNVFTCITLRGLYLHKRSYLPSGLD